MVLSDAAALIRSKNAGPFLLTFDIIFSDPEQYWHVQRADVLGPAQFAELYRCSADDVRFFECPNALAFKFTIPRSRVAGSFGDPDLHGCQQHAPLMDVQLPGPARTADRPGQRW
jgi:Domain of unknown function (DUF4387)